MLLNLDITAKTIGTKELFKNLKLTIEADTKVGLIGRNGVGKTTLFNILNGTDTDYDGDMQKRRGISIVSTAQEHHVVGQETVVAYVLNNLPEYKQLKHIIDTYPDTMGENVTKIQNYSNALERFSSLGYFEIEEHIINSLAAYQITPAMATAPMANLSGGQKRFVELVRIEHADADLALIDEPTNHMDYIAKAAFIEWLKDAKQTVVVITHDRDVLQHVDKIIEMKDGGVVTFNGNYSHYLKQNVVMTAAKMHDYKVDNQTLDNLQKKIAWARSRKPSWHGTADQRNPFEVMERRLQKEHDEIKAAMVKPSFWIDRESAENLPKTMVENYAKFKAKNIKLHHTTGDKHSTELLHLESVQLGHTNTPLFEPITIRVQSGERVQLVGRNGAGKTTLVKAIAAASKNEPIATLKHGAITCNKKLRLSIYEQEVSARLLDSTLSQAIDDIYRSLGLPVTTENTMRVMSNYLFDPFEDGNLQVAKLSGGQKARLQIIKMLANNPNLLILDEPTNHLDLPSIEELENALASYQGAVLYVSHDSYFAKNIGGEKLELQPTQ